MKLSKKIEKYLDGFEVKDRNGDTIVVFKPNRPEELYESVHKAHKDMLPNDFIFDKYHSILSAMSGYDYETLDAFDEVRSEIVNGLVDVYTGDLTAWLNSNNSNVYYIEKAQKEFGIIEDGFRLLSTAQYIAIDEIYSEVLDLLSD